MIKDSAKRLFDIIIVWKLDRFARNRYDSAHYKAYLRKNGAKVVSATEKIADDSTGILLESLLEGFAEFYSVELGEKVVRGMTENALKCRYNGGAIPLGFKVDEQKRFQLDEATAPYVLEAFQMYDNGKTVKQIVGYLEGKSVHTHYGKGMNINNVTNLLKNRKYIGEYRYRDVVVPNGVPAIVDEELFNRVQERLEKNKKAPARFKAVEENYLLTTKLHCGKCGAFMIGECGTNHIGKTYRYYKCATAKKRKGCNKKSAKKAWIEDLVIKEIAKMLFDDAIIDRIIDAIMELQSSDSLTLPALQKRLDETKRAIENILNAIQQGVFTSSTKERLETLEQARDELETDIALEELFRPFVSEDKIRFWLHKFRDNDLRNPEHRQRLVDSFINAIYLYDDKIVLTFNYKDGSKTVTLQEVERCSDMAFGGQPNSVFERVKLDNPLQMQGLSNFTFTGLLRSNNPRK
jgi:DNA invertase Pin-like site-specific DNA recombinase